jgi:hypothetical protein
MLGLRSPEHVGATVWAGSAETAESQTRTLEKSNGHSGQ